MSFLYPRHNHRPLSLVLIYFAVSDIEATLDKVVKTNKGKVLLPKTDIGEYGFYALFEDTEENRIGLHTC